MSAYLREVVWRIPLLTQTQDQRLQELSSEPSPTPSCVRIEKFNLQPFTEQKRGLI
ncbi:5238_t:CDS:2 [Ambispora leptoticha]|uniref:5238_t:CDS:1 n=1 Tax=Ambispora leptoticha TaxID=144679 RepID=A0A9N8WE41_9GLOM|nr:5238_t:CDS:2 [Ambispora leptoticha]